MVAFFKPPFAAWGGESTPDEDPEKDEPENEDEDEPDINVSEPLELEPEPEPKLEPLPELEPPREIELKSPLPNVDEPEKDDPICWTFARCIMRSVIALRPTTTATIQATTVASNRVLMVWTQGRSCKSASGLR